MSTNLAEDYTLANDINCGGATHTPVGSLATPFTGTFNGNNYTISNVVINEAGNFVGLFGRTNGGTVQNVRIRNFTVTGNDYVGGLAGYTSNTALQNIGVLNSSVSGDEYVGGSIGYQNSNSFSKGFAFGVTINAREYVGGLIGNAANADLDDMHVFSGTVTATEDFVGGLIGVLHSHAVATSLTNAYANATVSGNQLVGGLLGYLNQVGVLSCSISNTFATGNVSGTGDVGGLVGIKFSLCNIANSAFNDHAGNPSVCVGTDGDAGTTACTTVNNDQSFFYSSGNAPLSSWNFTSIWQTGPTFPLLSGALLQPAATGFSAIPTNSTVALAWTNPTNADFSSVSVRRSTTAFPASTTDGEAVVTNNTGTSYSDAGLADGTYYYSIFARDVWGNVSVRATASATVADTTQSPTLSQPGSSSTVSTTSMAVGYTLPETPLAGSVRITFSNAGTNVTLTLNNNTSASFTLNPLDVPASTQVVSTTSPVIPNGTYTVTLSYQDAAGNPAATAVSTNVTLSLPTATGNSSNTNSGGGGGGGGRRSGLGRSGSSPATHSAAPTVEPTAETMEQTVPPAPENTFAVRVCDRVLKWFAGNDKMLGRVNERLQKRFGFTCGQ